MKIQTRILIETQRTQVYKRLVGGLRGFCPSCSRDVTFLRVEDAARLIGEGRGQIFFYLSTNKIHSSLGEDGNPNICLVSLSTL